MDKNCYNFGSHEHCLVKSSEKMVLVCVLFLFLWCLAAAEISKDSSEHADSDVECDEECDDYESIQNGTEDNNDIASTEPAVDNDTALDHCHSTVTEVYVQLRLWYLHFSVAFIFDCTIQIIHVFGI